MVVLPYINYSLIRQVGLAKIWTLYKQRLILLEKQLMQFVNALIHG